MKDCLDRSHLRKLNPQALARDVLAKASQHEYFREEIQRLAKGKTIKASSQVISLSPFLDKDSCLRVGGRLQNSNYSFEKMHPLLLSPKHMLSKLIFKSEHINLLHAGPQLLLATVRDRYWVLAGRNLAKQTIRQCVSCFRASPKAYSQMMGSLPADRVNCLSPFTTTGVDFAGPVLIKSHIGRGYKRIKAYICLFVCFSTKAVHLELVTGLTTEAFLLAMRRFVARRGKPHHIYSDNGTNFIGAKSELDALGKFIKANKESISESMLDTGITWHFIPAYSPHFGGLWEAGIKSTKYHLKRVVGNLILTFECLYSTLVQIEAVLNSRPLCPLSTDPNDLNPLTPGHFLIGKGMVSLPDPDVSGIPESRLGHYQHIQRVQQHFWNRWSKEYVSELQQRTKWRQRHDDLRLGAMVLIKEDNLPPLQWKLGRVTQLFPGKDGASRVANVVTAKGVIKRSFTKLCPLPVCDSNQELKVAHPIVEQ